MSSSTKQANYYRYVELTHSNLYNKPAVAATDALRIYVDRIRQFQ